MSARPLTVAQVQTTVFRLPMHGELRWGKASSLAEVQHVLVAVHLSDGSVGQAEAPPRPTIYGETVASICHVIAEELAPRIQGMAVDAPAGDPPIWQAASLRRIQARLHEVKNNHTAIGALDMALHHALAQSRGLDLAQQLGAVRPRLKVSYILGIGGREEVLEEAQQVVAQGVRVLKVKVGRAWAEDLARIAELQATLGPGVALYADANECLTVDAAPRILAQLAEMGLLYCEEPLPVELIRERAALRRADPLPVIADDSAFSLRDLQRELALDTFHILNIKTARTGYTESGQMLELARRHGKGIMVGSQASAGLGTARAAAFAALAAVEHPSELSFFLKLKEDILSAPLTLDDGALPLAAALAAQVDPYRLREATVHPRGW